MPGDAAATVLNISASPALFRGGVAALMSVAVLDVIVAWSLHFLLSPVNAALSTLAAWLRVVYAAIFFSAILHLFDVAQLIDSDTPARLTPEFVNGQVAVLSASFKNGFDAALGVFGLHLVALGVLLFESTKAAAARSGLVPAWLAALVVVAGAGYVADSIGTILVSGYAFGVARFTFVGEPLLIFWLLHRGLRGLRSGRTVPPGAT